MRVSASAEVQGNREWFVWADGKTYASLGRATSAITSILDPQVPMRTAITDADQAERLFRDAFARLHVEPRILREDD
jgi:hypothetical protein